MTPLYGIAFLEWGQYDHNVGRVEITRILINTTCEHRGHITDQVLKQAVRLFSFLDLTSFICASQPAE